MSKKFCIGVMLGIFMSFGLPGIGGCETGLLAAQVPRQEEIDDFSRISEIISENWEEDYFGKIVVDPDSGELEKDGEKDSFSDEFDVSSGEARAVLRSESRVEDFLNRQSESTIYAAEINPDGDIEITAPYQTKRLVIQSLSVTGTFGASRVYRNEDQGEIILQFDTEEEARQAYGQITSRYGTDICYIDQVFYTDDLFADLESQTAESYCYSWGTQEMGMNALKASAHKYGYRSPVLVAVLDTGADSSHPLFGGNRISKKSYNFFNGNKNIQDPIGHGTHIAGIIADSTPSNVKIMMLRVTNGKGQASLLTLDSALNYAVSKGADVINMSLALEDTRQAFRLNFLDDVIGRANEKGIPVCVAAGNSGIDVKYSYPANTKLPITVGALNSDLSFASYSNRGSTIDFAAPGTNIFSSWKGNAWASVSGTSMAVPHIAAAAAYLKMMQSNLSVKGIVRELRRMSIDLGPKGKDRWYGWGCPELAGLFKAGIKNRDFITTSAVGQPKVKAVINQKAGIKISWKKVKCATKYKIYRKTGNGQYKPIKTVSSSRHTYVDRKIKQGKKYTYAVRAYQDGRAGKCSDGKAIIRLKRVTKVRARNRKGTSVRISWKKQGIAAGYQIRYSMRRNMKKYKEVMLNKNKSSVCIAKLRKKTYYYKVRSYYSAGKKIYYSSWSDLNKIQVK